MSGGRGRPLDLDRLSFPALTASRARLLTGLVDLASRDPEALRVALGLTPGNSGPVEADARLMTAPAVPVLSLYSGVLFEALDYASLTGSARRRAAGSLLVASALFGLVRPADRLPPYRLSGSTVLPGFGSLPRLWRPVLEPELTSASGLVVDLRSTTYAALARVPGAVSVRVVRERDGVRSVVSHDNKWTKGLLARALCEQGARTVADVAEAGRSLADDVQVRGRQVELMLSGLARSRDQTLRG